MRISRFMAKVGGSKNSFGRRLVQDLAQSVPSSFVPSSNPRDARTSLLPSAKSNPVRMFSSSANVNNSELNCRMREYFKSPTSENFKAFTNFFTETLSKQKISADYWNNLGVAFSMAAISHRFTFTDGTDDADYKLFWKYKKEAIEHFEISLCMASLTKDQREVVRINLESARKMIPNYIYGKPWKYINLDADKFVSLNDILRKSVVEILKDATSTGRGILLFSPIEEFYREMVFLKELDIITKGPQQDNKRDVYSSPIYS